MPSISAHGQQIQAHADLKLGKAVISSTAWRARQVLEKTATGVWLLTTHDVLIQARDV